MRRKGKKVKRSGGFIDFLGDVFIFICEIISFK